MDSNIDDLTCLISLFPNLEIQQLLTTLDEHKASGPDRISPYILKHCADELTPILHVILINLRQQVCYQMTGKSEYISCM